MWVVGGILWKASGVARDLLKAFVTLFFHNRQVAPGISCNSRTKEEYSEFVLFRTSSAGQGQVPNIIWLLEAALLQLQG